LHKFGIGTRTRKLSSEMGTCKSMKISAVRHGDASKQAAREGTDQIRAVEQRCAIAFPLSRSIILRC